MCAVFLIIIWTHCLGMRACSDLINLQLGPLFRYVCCVFILIWAHSLLYFYSCICSTFSLQTSVKTSSINLRSTSITHSTIKSSPLTLNSFIKSPQSVIITINFKHMVHSTHNIMGGRSQHYSQQV